jgi:uncharacterized protein (DUF2062 family)
MKKKNNLFFVRTLRLLYLKLFRTNDTPQKVACGLGIGVFVGILPGAGPFAAFVVAMLFRVNRAAAVLGALLTNTWTSLVTLLLAIKIGASIMSQDWRVLYGQWHALLRNFHWKSVFEEAFLRLVFPVLVGYLVIAMALGVLVYFISLFVLLKKGRGNMPRT